ncbi:hypothetical protein AB0I10_22430 [Streptomyces sp. NPDC050636]|uniref:hypothetical protein n=1 Tax=Streptomyces sp. NPDC050636 TaxID=3154510 RepID=UPI003419B42E
MDQGLAAVLGAGVGVLGTLGTASLAYIAARRQAVDQGMVHHWQRVRDDRRDAYLALLEEAATVTDVVHSFTPRAMPSESLVREAVSEMNPAVSKLYACATRVALAGSAEVGSRAFEVHKVARNWRLFLEVLMRNQVTAEEYGERLHEVTQAFTRALATFTGAARDLLQVPFFPGP